MLTMLCVATYFKGEAFLRECHARGCEVLLLTADTLVNGPGGPAGDDWPREAIREIHGMARRSSDAEIQRVVAAIARRCKIDRVVALDDFDVETGAMLREFLALPGFGRTIATRFRDKLAMRIEARRVGLTVPAFTPVFNDAEVDAWTSRVPAPWLLKPRSSAAATGIKRIGARDELWRALNAARDARPSLLLEQFVGGDVYHVDSIVRRGEIVFDVVSRYGRPPMQIAHEGGIFITSRLPGDAVEAAPLLEANRRMLLAFGLPDGVSHSEFIRPMPGAPPEHRQGAGPAPGVTFLETSARVGGAYITDMIEAATGVNLWREWAKIEVAGEAGAYELPHARSDSAGIALCLARQDEPDLSGYTDREIVMRIRKPHHAGLIVSSPDPQRVQALLDDYARRFSQDFLATMPLPERPAE